MAVAVVQPGLDPFSGDKPNPIESSLLAPWFFLILLTAIGTSLTSRRLEVAMDSSSGYSRPSPPFTVLRASAWYVFRRPRRRWCLTELHLKLIQIWSMARHHNNPHRSTCCLTSSNLTSQPCPGELESQALSRSRSAQNWAHQPSRYRLSRADQLSSRADHLSSRVTSPSCSLSRAEPSIRTAFQRPPILHWEPGALIGHLLW